MAGQSRKAGSQMTVTPSPSRYEELIEQSAEARHRGDHSAAQQFASAAHKWAMDEHVRVQRLEQAREALIMAKRQLDTSWDKDRTCATPEELLERHPEFKRVITAWQAAEQRVQELEEPLLHDDNSKKS